ncbi:unnamed protein product [Arabis nemorensis]|uniref:Glycoside hydrolase family 1 protein n=1 Tax=Arabis nemorensis TaxID=586526 RepID=A0A565B607_9BRAS|nr:unnamed protein product [Arabis nemorensis]
MEKKTRLQPISHPLKMEESLKFWSDPDTEVKLTKDTGVTVFRMGIGWSRVMPEEPTKGIKDAVNFEALEHYKWILGRVRSNGMKVMLTLLHHSLPPWAAAYGGWKIEKPVDYLWSLPDSWVTFNEPDVFTMLTYMCGSWPSNNPDFLEIATSTLPMGVFHRALHWMAVAHSKAYDYIHGKICLRKPLVGVAHHVSFTRPYGLFDIGAEAVSGVGLKLVETDEYSESGRGVYPDDVIRRPYLIEHLLAICAAMLKRCCVGLTPLVSSLACNDLDLSFKPGHDFGPRSSLEKWRGVPVLGYMFWTISDNWEWADGYGPKFGLVAVDRANNLARTLRPSYHLFSKPQWRPFVDCDWRFGHYQMDGLQDPLSRVARALLIWPLVMRKKIRKVKVKHTDDSGFSLRHALLSPP